MIVASYKMLIPVCPEEVAGPVIIGTDGSSQINFSPGENLHFTLTL